MSEEVLKLLGYVVGHQVQDRVVDEGELGLKLDLNALKQEYPAFNIRAYLVFADPLPLDHWARDPEIIDFQQTRPAVANIRVKLLLYLENELQTNADVLKINVQNLLVGETTTYVRVDHIGHLKI